MHLDPLYIQVLPRLLNTGSSEHIEGDLSITRIDVGFRHFDVPEGIVYDANLVNTSEAILLSGTASAELVTSCDRCLEATKLNISGEIQGYYLLEPAPEPDGEKLEVYELVDSRGRIDIAPPILAAVVYELAPVTLCKPDCEGVISLDGEDSQGSPALSTADGGDSVPKTDDINPESPFAALRDYRFDE